MVEEKNWMFAKKKEHKEDKHLNKVIIGSWIFGVISALFLIYMEWV